MDLADAVQVDPMHNSGAYIRTRGGGFPPDKFPWELQHYYTTRGMSKAGSYIPVSEI